MQYALATLAFAATALAQGVTQAIPPSGGAPGQKSLDKSFTIQTLNLSLPVPPSTNIDCGNAEGSLKITLKDTILTDSKKRIGYIADNRQFQFDGPPQTGAIYTAGFSVLGNGSISLGQNAIFYNCLSGSFNNIYDQSQGGQCYPVTIQVLECADSSGAQTGTLSGATSTAASSSSAPSSSMPPVNVMTMMYSPPPAAATPAPAASKGTAPAASGTGVKPASPTGPTASPSPYLSSDANAVVAQAQKILAGVVGAAAVALL